MGGKSFGETSFGQIIKLQTLATTLTVVLTGPRARVTRVVTCGALYLAAVSVFAPGAEVTLARCQEARPSTRGAVLTPGPRAGGTRGVAGATLIGGVVRVGPVGAGEAAAGFRGEVGEAVTGAAVPGPGT